VTEPTTTWREEIVEWDYAIRFLNHGHSLDFRAVEIAGRECRDGDPYDATGPWLFLECDWESSEDTTIDFDKAEVYADGSIKWDGCMEIDFGDGFHACGFKDAMRAGRLIEHVYRIAARELPNWNEEMAEFKKPEAE